MTGVWRQAQAREDEYKSRARKGQNPDGILLGKPVRIADSGA